MNKILVLSKIIIVSILFAISNLSFGAEKAKLDAVIELFSTDGCPKCASAYDLIHQYENNKNLLFLNYSIQLWQGQDKSQSEIDLFNQRHLNYNKQLKKTGIFMPQMIVNGTYSLVGSRKKALTKSLGKTKQDGFQGPAITLQKRNELMQLSVAASQQLKNAALILIGYDHVTMPPHKDHTLPADQVNQHSINQGMINQVMAFKKIGQYMGDAITLTLDKETLMDHGCDAYAILLQNQNTGQIYNAAYIDYK